MNECEAMLDIMPAVAAGRATWPTGGESHLRGCQDCQAAWRVIEAGHLLGGDATQLIDFGAMSAALQGRVVAARRRHRQRSIGAVTLLAAAAAVALVVWRGHPGAAPAGGSGVNPTPEARAFVIPVSGLEELDTPQLQAIYQDLGVPLGAGGTADAPALDELSPDEMSQVLSSYQG
jgi:hypothetical protein